MVPIRMASVGGLHGPRGSIFQKASTDVFSSPKLGATDQEWYSEAEKQVRRYDDLVERAKRIAYKDERERLLKYYNSAPDDSYYALYARNYVDNLRNYAQTFTPPNVLVFHNPEEQDKVRWLRGWNDWFADDVQYQEKHYGTLPPQQVVEVEKTRTQTAVPGWVPIVVVGSVGIAALAALGVFGRK